MFEVTLSGIPGLEATVFDVTIVSDVTGVFEGAVFAVTASDLAAPGLSVTDRSPLEAPESPVAAFAIHHGLRHTAESDA
ncbi:MAG TPA: hypothetical protein VFU73_10365 [Actinocrinis sp.]|nr:hypothetical protein [Actinocrinis sp.]